MQRGEKNTGSHGNSDYVVDESPEQVLSDNAHRATRELDGLRKGSQVGRSERHHCRFDGDVGATTHSHADVGTRESLRVVDAVADHSDSTTFRLLRLDVTVFVVG